MFPGLDLLYADPAQPLTMAGEEQDDLDHDLSDLSEVCNLCRAFAFDNHFFFRDSEGQREPPSVWCRIMTVETPVCGDASKRRLGRSANPSMASVYPQFLL